MHTLLAHDKHCTCLRHHRKFHKTSFIRQSTRALHSNRLVCLEPGFVTMQATQWCISCLCLTSTLNTIFTPSIPSRCTWPKQQRKLLSCMAHYRIHLTGSAAWTHPEGSSYFYNPAGWNGIVCFLLVLIASNLKARSTMQSVFRLILPSSSKKHSLSLSLFPSFFASPSPLCLRTRMCVHLSVYMSLYFCTHRLQNS